MMVTVRRPCRGGTIRVLIGLALAAAIAPRAVAQSDRAPPATGQPPVTGQLAAPSGAPPVTLEAPPQLPLDPAAAKAFTVLEDHCARCHQAGWLKRAKPAKNFGNILQLDQLARDINLVRPGNPDGSAIYTHMVKREMPYDVFQEFSGGAGPTASEIGAVAQWIEGLGGAPPRSPLCNGRKFIPADDVARTIGQQLKAGAAARAAARGTARGAASGLRFITLTHLYNACASDREMEVYRQGVVKLLNSLSQNPKPLKLDTIDAARTIIRFRLSDLGWDGARWEKLVAAYPYRAAPLRWLKASLLAGAGTIAPYLRGDWLAYAAMRPPLYFDLLDQPDSARALQRSLGLDVEANIRGYLAKRAGFNGSGIAVNNRLIERHETAVGPFWITYDFGGGRGRRNLKSRPLGPAGNGAFEHDLNAMIYGLPNGFFGFYLANAKGERLGRAPSDVLRDDTARDGVVWVGLSCLACHRRGVRDASDEIRAVVRKKRSFGRTVRDAVDGLYPPAAEMDRLMASDVSRFRGAMVGAGLDPDLTLSGVEIINALAQRYARDLDLRTAAAELGIGAQDLTKRLGGTAGDYFQFMRRLSQASVPRRQFEEVFGRILRRLDNKTTGAAGALQSGPKRVGANGAPGRTARTFDLAIYSDKSVYKSGEIVQFWAISDRDCNLTVINVDKAGKGTVIFPNDFDQNNELKAGRALKLPASGAPYKFRLRDKGAESVIAICNTRVDSADGISHDFEKQKFTDLGNYRDFLKNAIEDGETGRGSVRRKARRRRRTRQRGRSSRAQLRPEIQARTGIRLVIR